MTEPFKDSVTEERDTVPAGVLRPILCRHKPHIYYFRVTSEVSRRTQVRNQRNLKSERKDQTSPIRKIIKEIENFENLTKVVFMIRSINYVLLRFLLL